MERLSADFSAAFQRDLKKKAAGRGWDLSRLEEVVDSAPRILPSPYRRSSGAMTCTRYPVNGLGDGNATSPTQAIGLSSGLAMTRPLSSSGRGVTKSRSGNHANGKPCKACLTGITHLGIPKVRRNSLGSMPTLRLNSAEKRLTQV